MSKLRSVVVGAVLLIGSTAGASAADMWVPAGSMKDSYKPVNPSVAISEGASWYIRGDIGYAWNQDLEAVAVDQYVAGIKHMFNDTKFDDAWSFGGGIGFYFSHNLRGDITIDYREGAQFEGTVHDSHLYWDENADNDSDPYTNPSNSYQLIHSANDITKNGIFWSDPATGHEQYTHIAGHYKFDIQSTVYLANLYYDFNMRAGFRPYLGVGVGFANHEVKTGEIEDICGCTGEVGSNSETDFAFALMAGTAYEVRKGVNLDVGYRYSNLGKATSGISFANVSRNGVTSHVDTVIDTKYIESHEVRVGLRYDIW